MRTLMHGLVVAAVAAAALVTVSSAHERETNNCFSRHTSGTGKTFMQFCVSEHGNLVQFEAPEGYHHIGQENDYRDGFVVCSSDGTAFVTHAYDAGALEAGWDVSKITQPNGPNTLPLTITRNTADGIWELKQQFTRDAAELEVAITATLKNLSGARRTEVMLTRYYEGDANNNLPFTWFAAAANSVFNWSNRDYGLSLIAASLKQTIYTTLVPLTNFYPGDCRPLGQISGPTTPGNNTMGWALYIFPSIGAGQSKAVQFVYRRL